MTTTEVVARAPEATSAPPGVARLRAVVVVLSAWGTTRLVLLLLLAAPREAGTLADVYTYRDWARAAWAEGLLPGRDYAWEYPPGAAALVLLPFERFADYLTAFSAVALLLDLVVVAVLLRERFRGAGWSGTVLWLVGPFLLGPVFVTRFDLAAGMLVAAALVLVATRPAWAGALLAIGASVKLWPLVVLAAVVVAAGRARSVLAGFTVAVAVLAVVAAGAGVLATVSTSLAHQDGRGLQVETPAAAPFLWRAVDDADQRPVYRSGAWEVPQPVADDVATAMSAAGVLLLIALLARRLRTTPLHADPALLAAACIGVLVVTNKALSPQYLVWLLAAVAVAAGRGLPRARAVIGLLLACCLLTHLVYPLTYEELLGGDVLPLLALTARNVLLVAVVALLFRSAWSAGRTVRGPRATVR